MSPDESCAICGRNDPGRRADPLLHESEGRARGWSASSAAGGPSGSAGSTRRRPGPRRSAPARAAEAPESPLGRLERAALRFNASEAARTVAGLIRTLGRPWVSIGSLAGSPSEVRVTVAWELTWYQWGVDLGDEMRAVFEIDKGNELDQLDGSARQWNASASRAGGSSSALGAERAGDGEPVG